MVKWLEFRVAAVRQLMEGPPREEITDDAHLQVGRNHKD